MLQKLLDDHRMLAEKGAALRTLLDRALPPEPQALADARWALGSMMMQHLAFESRHLYTHLEQDSRPDVRTLGARFQADLTATFGPYVEHAKGWTPEKVAADWNSYRAEAKKLLVAMLARIAREERELFPFIREQGIDTAQPGPVSVSWTRDAFAIKDSIRGRG